MNIDEAWKIAQREWQFKSLYSRDSWKVADLPKNVNNLRVEPMGAIDPNETVSTFEFVRWFGTWNGQPAVRISSPNVPTFRKVYLI